MKLLSTLFASILAVGAWAQVSAFDVHVANIAILQAKPVQQEMGITASQRKRMNVAADKYTKEMHAYDAELRKQKSPRVDRKRVSKYQQELKVGVLSQLSPAQIKRLRELSLQYEQVVALTDPVVAEFIGASKKQIKKLQQIFQAGAANIQRIGAQAENTVISKYRGIQPKNAQERSGLQKQFTQEMSAAQRRVGPELKQIADQNTAQMMAVLTPKQKTAWIALQGRTFTFHK